MLELTDKWSMDKRIWPREIWASVYKAKEKWGKQSHKSKLKYYENGENKPLKFGSRKTKYIEYTSHLVSD